MRSNIRACFVVAILALLETPLSVLAQQPQQQLGFDQLVNRARDALTLNDQQTAELRNILQRRAPTILMFRRRAQTQTYSPQLQAEIEAEHQAIREELTPRLTEEQKQKLPGVSLRPVPLPPPFLLIDLPFPSRAEHPSTSDVPEKLLPAVVTKGRLARLSDDHRVLHLLNRITFGPAPGDLERVKRAGIQAFIQEQLAPEKIDDSEVETRLAALPTLRMTASERYVYYPQVNVAEQRAKQTNSPPVFGRPQQILVELIQQKLVRSVYSKHQLQEVMTDFWFNHFNVFAQKGADLWMITTYEREAIRPHALGKFRDLLLATAQSPAMLFYLDNWLSASEESRLPRPPNRQGQRQPQAQPPQAQPAEMQPQAPRPPQQRRQGVNENYARELLELHTLGVNGGYSQKDVQEIARCFTGWTIDRPNQGGGFIFRRWAHDSGSKTVLGVGIPAGGGIEDGYRVINILARHPSTARFISRKLCQRFVADDPPAVLVERIAQTFLKTDGDIRQVLGAIFSSAEFNSAAAFRSKLKSPLELIASAIRTLGGDTNGAPALHEWIRRMGGPLYQHQAPTGYSEDSSSWMNTGAFVNRINFAVAVANNQIPGTRYKSERFLKPESSLANGALIDRLAASTIHTELSPDSRKAVETALGQNPSGQSLTRAIELMLGTVEFQRK